MIEATEARPCLALSLQLDIPLVRDFSAARRFRWPKRPPTPPAWRLVRPPSNSSALLPAGGPAGHAARHSLSQRPDSARDRLPDSPQRGGSASSRHCDAGEQSHRTAKAIAWIGANYAKPLRVEELADIAGMGVSTLHHHFRVLTAMSPLQYQKQLRLQAARGRMLVDGLDAASAAFEVGYESASQFNREYSRFFGQPPMRDLRALRSPGAPQMESAGRQSAI